MNLSYRYCCQLLYMLMSKFMRLFVMFDLPTNTAEQRRAAGKFRKFLVQDGFYMMQYSIYIRICNGLEAAQKHENRVKMAVPVQGSVRILRITEKQYAAMQILCGNVIADLDKNYEKEPVTLF